MKLELYSVKDTISGTMEPPFAMTNKGVCLRGISEAVNAKEPNPFNTYTKDKQLFKVGEYDNKTGEIEPKIEFVCNLIELKTTQEKE